MSILRTHRLLRPNPLHRLPERQARLPSLGRVASAGAVVRRSRPGCRSARAAAPASPPDSRQNAFNGGTVFSTLGADVKSSEVSGFYKKSPEDRWQVIRSFGELSDAEVETIR